MKWKLEPSPIIIDYELTKRRPDMNIRRSYHIPLTDGGELTVSEGGDRVEFRYLDDSPFSISEESWRALCQLNYEIRFNDPPPKPEDDQAFGTFPSIPADKPIIEDWYGKKEEKNG